MVLVVLTLASVFAAFVAAISAWSDHRLYKIHIQRLKTELEYTRLQIERRGLLANELAHEIKNPIAAILCSVETLDLVLGDSIDKDHRKSFKYIKEFSQALLRQISDFIDVTRAEGGTLSAYPTDVDLKGTIDSVAGLLSSSAIQRRIKVNFEKDDSLSWVYADSRHVKQIIFNLLHNAIKFTNPGGTVEVSIEASHENSMIVVVVRDSGIGIPTEKLSRVFDPYARISEEKQGEEGVGLGLTLAKALTELNGGTIRIDSVLGVGTTVEVCLRASSPERLASQDITETNEERSIAKDEITVSLIQ